MNYRSTTLAGVLSIEKIPCDYSHSCKLSCVRILSENLPIWTSSNHFLNVLRGCWMKLYKTHRHLYVDLNFSSENCDEVVYEL